MVADLLQAGQQLEHQPAPGLLVGALDARPSCRARTTRRARPARGSGRAGGRSRSSPGSSGRDAGVALAAAQQERPDQARELPRLGRLVARLDRPRPDLAERLPAAEQPRASPSRGSPTARSGCSPPGCRSARPAPATGPPAARARSPTGRSSRAAPRRPRPGPTATPPASGRRAGACRTSSARTPGRAAASVGTRSSRERCPPWNRRTSTPGAKRRTSASQLPSSEAGQTTRVGPGRRVDAVEVERDQRDGLAEAHVVGEAGARARATSAGRAR